MVSFSLPPYLTCQSSTLTVSRQGLIAVNYPARGYGIGRHCTVAEAKKLCPNLINQHVATWREGDDKWWVMSGHCSTAPKKPD